MEKGSPGRDAKIISRGDMYRGPQGSRKGVPPRRVESFSAHKEGFARGLRKSHKGAERGSQSEEKSLMDE